MASASAISREDVATIEIEHHTGRAQDYGHRFSCKLLRYLNEVLSRVLFQHVDKRREPEENSVTDAKGTIRLRSGPIRHYRRIREERLGSMALSDSSDAGIEAAMVCRPMPSAFLLPDTAAASFACLSHLCVCPGRRTTCGLLGRDPFF